MLVIAATRGDTYAIHLTVITSLTEGGPAEKMGLKIPDIILEINGNKVGNSDQLREAVRTSQKKRDHTYVAGILLLGGLVWLAVGRSPLWPGVALTAGGALWIALAWRR